MEPTSTSETARMRGYSQEESWFAKHNSHLLEKLRAKYGSAKSSSPAPNAEPASTAQAPPLKVAA
jgi:hypothetical protein